MREIVLLLCAAVLLGGCAPTARLAAPVPAPVTCLSTSPYPGLKAKLDALIPDSLFPPGHIGMKIVSLTSHQTLYSLNSALLFNPASNEKLFTSATALTELGESFPFPTVVSADSAAARIYLKGFGDPLLASGDLDSLARVIREALPANRRWSLAADISYFDSTLWGPGWAWDDEPASYQMYVTPLILNSNAVDVKVSPGPEAGAPVNVTTNPVSAYFSVDNSATTVIDTALVPLEVSRRWQQHLNVITVKGQMLKNDTGTVVSLNVWRPELYAAAMLAEKLRALGMKIMVVAPDTIPPSAFEVTRRVHTLDTVITFMNKVSDNLSAESLAKTLAARTLGVPGSTDAGTTLIKEFLSGSGIDTTRVSIVDGSGLSRYDLTSADAVTALLAVMYAGPHFAAYYHSLPIAGVDGTIEHRMRGTPAEGNLRAKTGSLTSVSTLSGYVRNRDGDMLAFSLLMQNFPGATRGYRQVQDRIGAFLAGTGRSDW